MVGRDLSKTIEPLLCIRYFIPLASVDIICTFVLCSVDTVTNWACHQCRAVSNAKQQYHIKGYSDIDNSLSLLYNVRKSFSFLAWRRFERQNIHLAYLHGKQPMFVDHPCPYQKQPSIILIACSILADGPTKIIRVQAYQISLVRHSEMRYNPGSVTFRINFFELRFLILIYISSICFVYNQT